MNANEVFYLIDQHMDAEYALADANDLAALQNQVTDLSDQVDGQAIHIASLTNDRDELIKTINMLAKAQKMPIALKVGKAP